jgi:hypothetical protein
MLLIPSYSFEWLYNKEIKYRIVKTECLALGRPNTPLAPNARPAPFPRWRSFPRLCSTHATWRPVFIPAPHPSQSAMPFRPHHSRVRELHLRHTREPQQLDHWGLRLPLHQHIQIYFCNTKMKQLQHISKKYGTFGTYTCNIAICNICNIQIKH